MRTLFPVILLGLFFYFVMRFFWFFFPDPAFGALPIVVTLFAYAALLLLIFVLWKSDDPTMSRRDQLIEKFGHLSFGYVSFLFVYLLIRDFLLLLVPAHLAEVLRSPGGNLSLFALVVASVAAGFWNASRGPAMKHVKVKSNFPLPKGTTLKIVQISDLHVGSWIRKQYVDNVVAQVRALGEIDLLLLTGDIGDGDPALNRAEIAPLGTLPARLGKFSVSGNHEGYWSESAWNEVIRALGFHVLENESAATGLGSTLVRIAGIADAKPNTEAALANLTPESLNIFLAHQPKHADRAAAFTSSSGGKVHLQLSGHTHNGQYFPWNLVIGLFQKYPRGLYTVASMKLYVNVGTGFWGAPMRLGTRSEITFLELISD